MDFEEFKDDIMTSLGGNLIDVELEDKDIMLCFKKAKRTFQQKGHNSYRRDFYRLKVNKCQTRYSLPSSIHTIIKTIKPTIMFNNDDAFVVAAYNSLFSGSTTMGGDWLSYDLTMQSVEMWRRYMAFDVQFHYDEFKNEITFLKPPEGDVYWLLEVYHDLSDEEYMEILWIQSWAIAEAKVIIGAAYRKFSQLPGPDGAISLDGNSLIQESKDEKAMLLEDILNGVDGGNDYYEIVMG
jgi:hypothetical protein